MFDLNKQLFFRTQFQISDSRPDTDILWQVVLKVRKWMGDKWANRGVAIPTDYDTWTRFKFGGHLSSEDGQLVNFTSTYFVPDYPLGDFPATPDKLEWACTITESFEEPGFAPRDWTSEISYHQEHRGSGTLAVIISYADRAGYLGPVQPAPFNNVPRIVRWFMNDRYLSCSIAGQPISMAPYEVTCENLEEFWGMVSDPQRGIPVVYLSPRYLEDGTFATLIEPKDLTWVLGPNAIVAYSLDAGVSSAMMGVVGDDKLRCTGGTIRIYSEHPRFDLEGDDVRHRFFSPRKIEEFGPDQVKAFIQRVLSQDVNFYDSVLRQETVKTHLRRARFAQMSQMESDERVSNLRQELEEQSLDDMIKLEDKLLAAQEEADIYAEECDDLQQKLFLANSQIEVLTSALNSNTSKGGTVHLESWPPSPESIVKLFLQAYPDRFDLTDAGWKSLNDCTTDADILWNSLNDLVTVAWPLYEEGVGDIEKEFNSRSRFELAKTEGRNTKRNAKMVAGYDDEYNGKTYSCMAHIINGVKESDGKFIRIYFCFAREEGKIIVSSIGKHKTNYTTSKM